MCDKTCSGFNCVLLRHGFLLVNDKFGDLLTPIYQGCFTVEPEEYKLCRSIFNPTKHGKAHIVCTIYGTHCTLKHFDIL